MDIETLLNDEIRDEFQQLEKMELGSEEYKATVDGITKLVDRAIELEKINIGQDEKKDQMHEKKIDRWVQIGIAASGLLLPMGLTIWGTYKTFQFEEKGTITTSLGRRFIGGLFFKK